MRAIAVGPLGKVPIVAAPPRWRPQLVLKQIAANSTPYLGVGPQKLRAVVQDAQGRTAARFFQSGLLPNHCGGPDSPPCDEGSPRTALSGFGQFGGFGRLGILGAIDAPKPRSTPGFCAPVRTLLSELEWLLDKVTYNSDVVRQAKFVYDDLNSNWAYVPGTGGCDRDAATLAAVIAGLRQDMVRNGSPAPGGSTALTPESQSRGPDVDPVVKLAVIGGIAVAGIIGLAVISGNAASIIKVFR